MSYHFRHQRLDKSLSASRLFTVVFALIFLFSFSSAAASSLNLSVTIIGDKECNDGVDNDNDNKIDYPADPGCVNSSDDDETNVAPPGSNQPLTGGGGSGGGSGGGGSSISTNAVIFKGRAYPGSSVTILKDAQVAAVTPVGPDANFEARLSGLAAGTYVFSVRARDNDNRHSLTNTFTVGVTSGVTTVVSGIFIPPTINLDKIEVKRGDILNILGQSVPNAAITILINSDTELVRTTTADADGSWLYRFDTLEIDYGQHTAKSRAARGGEISNFSQSVSFRVGNKNTPFITSAASLGRADINNDLKVNLADFSIMAYWYNRSAPPAAVDLNGDRVVNLVDFSIMAFYWTG